MEKEDYLNFSLTYDRSIQSRICAPIGIRDRRPPKQGNDFWNILYTSLIQLATLYLIPSGLFSTLLNSSPVIFIELISVKHLISNDQDSVPFEDCLMFSLQRKKSFLIPAAFLLPQTKKSSNVKSAIPAGKHCKQQVLISVVELYNSLMTVT
jgi:hypothetical protein